MPSRSMCLLALLAAAAMLACVDAFAPAGLHPISSAPGLRPAAPAGGRRTCAAGPVMMAKAKKGGGKSDKMQVLLKTNIDGVGKANEVVQVNLGYYNNFLRPKDLAKIISDEEVEVKNEKEAEELARIKQVAVDMAADIKSMGKVTMKRKVGAGGKLFGTVTHKQIMDEVKSKSGGKVELTQKMKMEIPKVEGLGEFTVEVQLHPEVSTKFGILIEEEK